MLSFIQAVSDWTFEPSLVVYVACKMTGRDKVEMVERAKFGVSVFEKYGIKAISPVLKEEVSGEGKLINNDKERLARFWADDKYIIRRVAHAVVFDQAEMSSFGMTREYSLNRGTLWKPSVIVTTAPASVAIFEDDAVVSSLNAAASLMSRQWGSRWKRWIWRTKMINRSLLKFLLDQLWSWR